jgi:hypothetical protein
VNRSALEGQWHSPEIAAGEVFGRFRNKRRHPFLLGAEDFGSPGNGFAKAWTESPLDRRDDGKAELVPRMKELGIGRILAKSDAAELLVKINFSPLNAQHRTVNSEGAEFRDRLHSRQSRGASATKEIEKAGLDLVIGVVGQDEVPAFVNLGALGKEGLAKLSGGEFEGYFLLRRELGRSCPGRFQFTPQRLGMPTNENQILPRGSTAQGVIEMADDESLESEPNKCVE